MKARLTVFFFLLFCVGVIVACAPAPAPAPVQQPTVVPQPAIAPTQASQPTTAPTQAPLVFNWKKYSGTTIRVLFANMPYTDFIKPQLAEFEALTGIKVTFENFVEDQLRQKLTVELAAGGTAVDVFGSMTVQEGLQYDKAGWYVPLKPYVDDKTLTNPDFDFADFTKGAVKISSVGDKLVGIPVYSDAGLFYYNKALLKACGAQVPTTFDELAAVAAKCTDPKTGVFGWVNRGKGAAATSVFSSFLYGMGGKWVDASGKPTLNTPEAIKAFQYWGDLLRKYGPPGSENNSWPEALQLFCSGKAVMWADSGVQAATTLDPTKCQIAKDVGFAQIPGGQPYAYGWIMSIPPSSKNKEAAWYFIQWATNKKSQLDALKKGIPAARSSAWNSPDFKANDPHPDLTLEMSKALDAAMPYMNPPIIPVQAFRDAVGVVIVTAISGGDVKAAADIAQQTAVKLLGQ